MILHRRSFLATAAALGVAPALGQHAGHAPPYEPINKTGRVELPPIALEQRVLDGPAPKAANMGRWLSRAELPMPRTEMAWAVARAGRMHLIGGYGETRVDHPFHHAYVPSQDRWLDLALLPRGVNHVGVATLDERIFAFGGFVEQNRRPDPRSFVFGADDETWREIRPLPRAAGSIACVALGGLVHLIGGAIGDTFDTKKSIDWHLVYDPKEDRYSDRAPLPLGRDHTGVAVVDGRIHVVGGRVDSFHTNSALHHSYDAAADRWTARNPMPTQRSGHGAVLYRGRIHCMGGEGTNRVFGVHEAYDPQTDRWETFAPMLTPRHGTGAVVVGDFIHVAGGGPIVGGGIKSAVHEAFTLG